MESCMTIRKADIHDIGKVAELLVENFGHLAISEGALSNFIDRYYVAISDTGDIIGVSGIIPEGEHYTVTFSCVSKKNQGKGVMTSLFSHMLKDYDTDKIITLCAWHLQNSEKANLFKIAEKFGFVLIKPAFINRINGISQNCNGCIYENDLHCECCDDLYVKLKEKEK